MSSQPIKGAYYPSWSDLTPADIETQYFTHIYYAFLNPEAGSFQFNISQDQAARLLDFTNTLHAKSPPVKVLFAVGGASAESTVFGPMVSDAQSRAAFIRSTIQVARTYGFDGVDLDWEFPENQGKMNELGTLLREWRAEVQNEARTTGQAPLLLTAAVYFAASIPWGNPREYPTDSIRENLDFVNVMCYDYYGSWDPATTGAQAALYDPNGPLPRRSTSDGLNSWIQNDGVPPNKVVMGMPLYGRTWTLESTQHTNIGAPAVGVGPGDGGVLNYAQVVASNNNLNAQVVHDQPTGSVYSVAGRVWISYDDEWSVREKIRYARNLRVGPLGGYFFWAVNGDHQWALSRTASNLWP